MKKNEENKEQSNESQCLLKDHGESTKNMNMSNAELLPSTQSRTTFKSEKQPEAVSMNPVEDVSIYSIRTNQQRILILSVLALVAFLLPFCDTVYLPALNEIKNDLKTSNGLVVLGVSIYFITGAASGIVWGQASDRFGRRVILLISLVSFLVVTIGCVFAPNIALLIILRAIEGGMVSATIVVGQSLVADIYPEETRGSATGFFFIPFNVGPILGPLIGGPLSAAFGWRSVFIFLGIYSLIAVVAVFFFVPETHQYFVKETFNKSHADKRIIDAVPNDLAPFQNVLKPLIHLFNLSILPYIAVASTMLATLINSVTMFSFYLQQAPYEYGPAIIGVLYVPSGVSLLVGSIFGGWISDKASKYFGDETCPERRLVPNMILSILTPIGLTLFGWAFQFKISVAVPIIAQILISLGQTILESSISTYLTVIKQAEAAGVSAANNFLNFFTAGILVSFAVPLQNVVGAGWYFTLLAILNIASITWAGVIVYRNVKKSKYVSV